MFSFLRRRRPYSEIHCYLIKLDQANIFFDKLVTLSYKHKLHLTFMSVSNSVANFERQGGEISFVSFGVIGCVRNGHTRHLMYVSILGKQRAVKKFVSHIDQLEQVDIKES